MGALPVRVLGLVRDQEEHDTVLLREDGGRVLPVAIGPCEAAAIWVCLAPEAAVPYVRRPWTPDLIQAMAGRLGAQLQRVDIDELSLSTFYAKLTYLQGDREVVVDCRPSDALALALRADVPLFVAEEVMDRAGMVPRPADEEDGAEESDEEPDDDH